MATLPIHISMKNMIHMACSTYPSPWTAFTKSSYLSFASMATANILLIFIFRGRVPRGACPSSDIMRCLRQYMVNNSSLCASLGPFICAIAHICIIDESLSQLLAKGYEFHLLTLEIDPCKVRVHFSNGKNKSENSDWPAKCTPCGLKRQTLLCPTILSLVVVVINSATVGIVVGHDLGILEFLRDILTIRILEMPPYVHVKIVLRRLLKTRYEVR